ncbi:unnamed protein product [Calypogeia fissa]
MVTGRLAAVHEYCRFIAHGLEQYWAG